MVDNFTIQEIREIRQCFELYAKKRYIDKETQLRFILRTIGHVVTPEEVKNYMREYGPRIRLSQFLELLWQDRQKPEDPVWEVAKAFQNLDEHQSGLLNRTKLFTLLTSFGEKMEPIEVEIALEKMRLSGYGLRIPIADIIEHISG